MLLDSGTRSTHSLGLRPTMLAVLVCGLLLAGSLFSPPAASALTNGVNITSSATAPWFATLDIFHTKKARTAGEGSEYSCGGVLIAPEWVMTAAHCFHHGSNGLGALMAPGDGHATVIIAATTTTGSNPLKAADGQTRTAASWTVDPDPADPYMPGRTGDIALVKLSVPVTNVPPVTLGTNLNTLSSSTSPFVALGRGYAGSGIHGYLQEAELPLFKPYTSSVAFGPGSSTGSATSYRCWTSGDSGGPVILHPDPTIWTVVGVISATVSAPAACTRTWLGSSMRPDAVRGWLDATVPGLRWQDIATPTQVSTLTSETIPSGMHLSWAPVATDANHDPITYTVSWDDGNANQVRTVSPGRTDWDLLGLPAGTTYHFAVTANNVNGHSVDATVTGTAGAAPLNSTGFTTSDKALSCGLLWPADGSSHPQVIMSCSDSGKQYTPPNCTGPAYANFSGVGILVAAQQTGVGSTQLGLVIPGCNVGLYYTLTTAPAPALPTGRGVWVGQAALCYATGTSTRCVTSGDHGFTLSASKVLTF